MLSFCQKSWVVVKNIRFPSVNMTCRSVIGSWSDDVTLSIMILYNNKSSLTSPIMLKSTFPAGYGHHQFLIKYHIFCQKSWKVVKNIRFPSVKMTCRSILVFAISVRNVQFLSEVVGSGQKHKVSFGKYDMPISNRFWDSCSKCSVSARNVKNLKKW